MEFLKLGLLIFLALFSFRVQADDFFQGKFSNRYKLRATGSASDQRWESIATLDFGHPDRDKISGGIQAGGIFTLAGPSGGSTFSSIYDTFGSRAIGRLYYGYVDVKDVGPVKGLRAGRQNRYEFESLYYDGATLESGSFHGLSLTAYGGTPVHLFENQIGFTAGDWLAGGALDWAPDPRVKSRFDVVHLKDKQAGFRASTGHLEDTLFGGSLWFDPVSSLALFSRFTSFHDQVRDLTFSSTLRVPEKDFTFRFDFYRLLQGYDIRVLELDAYSLAGTYQPYTELGWSATKGWGQHFAVDGGFSVRMLDQNQTASSFNHGFERLFLSASTFDLPIEGLSLTATGDYYRGEDSTFKNDSFGASFFAAQEFLKKRFKVSGGTAHYLYRFNLFTGNESHDVQTYFAAVEGKIVKDLKGKVGYEFEHNDIDNFHSADVRLIWSF